MLYIRKNRLERTQFLAAITIIALGGAIASCSPNAASMDKSLLHSSGAGSSSDGNAPVINGLSISSTSQAGTSIPVIDDQNFDHWSSQQNTDNLTNLTLRNLDSFRSSGVISVGEQTSDRVPLAAHVQLGEDSDQNDSIDTTNCEFQMTSASSVSGAQGGTAAVNWSLSLVNSSKCTGRTALLNDVKSITVYFAPKESAKTGN